MIIIIITTLFIKTVVLPFSSSIFHCIRYCISKIVLFFEIYNHDKHASLFFDQPEGFLSLVVVQRMKNVLIIIK